MTYAEMIEIQRRELDVLQTAISKRLAINPLSIHIDDTINENHQLENTIGSVINAIFLKKYKLDDQDDNNVPIPESSVTVEIVNSKNTEPFFGVRIFPALDTMERIVRAMIVDHKKIDDLRDMWITSRNWHIEIDANIFDRQAITLTPEEIISLILQAWCKTVKDATPLERFVECCKEWFYVKPISELPNPNPFYAGMRSLTVHQQESVKVMHLVFMIPLWISCKCPDILYESPEKSMVAYQSDAMTTNELISQYIEPYKYAVGKLVRVFGNTFDSGEENSIAKVGSYVRWALLNAVDENRRYRNMKDNLLQWAHMTTGQYAAALVIKILNDFSVGLRERYTGAILESAQMEEVIMSRDELLDRYAAVNLIGVDKDVLVDRAVEALMRDKKKNQTAKPPLLPSDYDIDVIGVEVDRIANHHDRVYVLDLIYRKIEEIQVVLQYYDTMDDTSSKATRVRQKAESQLKRLAEYRAAIMKKRSFNTDYKVFVRVPEGYEG